MGAIFLLGAIAWYFGSLLLRGAAFWCFIGAGLLLLAGQGDVSASLSRARFMVARGRAEARDTGG